MTDDLPPRRHPADPPWWSWGYINVRRWARMRRGGRFVFGSIAGATWVALQLAIRQFELRRGYDPSSVGGILFGGIFFGTFLTLVLWNRIERSYHEALERRAQYEADRERSEREA
jgi:hypothetical protein